MPQIKRRLAAVAIALLAWFGVIVQLVIMVQNAAAENMTVGMKVGNFFSYFTIQNNLAVATVLTAIGLFPGSKLRDYLDRPRILGAVCLYIVIVGLVYSLVLRMIWTPEGLQKLVDHILHDIVPPLFLLFWIFWVPHRKLVWRDTFAWLVYPLIYFGYSMLRGAFVGWYPYPFLDVPQRGWLFVLGVVVLLAFVFEFLALLVVGVDRRLR